MVPYVNFESFKMRIGIITEARMTSSRLPGKHLLKIGDKPIFEIFINQIKKSKLTTNIILATTINKEDDILCEVAEQLEIDIYRGSEENVLERVIGAATSQKIDVIVEITADCPLIDPNLIDQAIKKYIENNYQYVGNTIDRQFADGMDVEVYSTEFLRETYSPSMDPYFLEHVTAHIVSSDKYSKYNLVAKKEQYAPDARITLDTVSDFKIIKQVYTKLVEENLEINCKNVTSL